MPKTTCPSKEQIEQAGALIRTGKLVAFPTETVYGLGANALDVGAVGRIFRAKGRPATSPLIVHVDSVAMARGLASCWPEQAELLTQRFWPGPLTVVLPKNPQVPDIVTAGLPTVGLRMPANSVALELIRSAGVPIAAPSANLFSTLSPTTARHVRNSLGSAVDLILDGGPTTVGIESTVVSLVGDTPKLLRPGMISRAELEAILGLLGEVQAAEPDQSHPSPGMHLRHYSPATPIALIDAGKRLPQGRGAYLWLFAPAKATVTIQMPASPEEYAAILYETLHRLDEQNLEWIAIEKLPEDAPWSAIRDRLARASR